MSPRELQGILERLGKMAVLGQRLIPCYRIHTRINQSMVYNLLFYLQGSIGLTVSPRLKIVYIVFETTEDEVLILK